MPIKVPDEIAKIYDYLPFKPEHYRLDTEPRYATPGKRSVLVRALDDFVFIKDGKFAYPIYGLSTDWWNGVTAYGWMMSPVGEFKYMAWAGDWGSSFPGKHMELVELKNLRGLSKEANKHWRKGQEEALWLETRECMTYVLLEPAKPYDAAAGWGCVIASWTKLPGAQSQRDPTFTPIDPEDDRPAWWFGSDSNKSWNHFQRPIKEAERREAAARKRKVEKGKGKKPLRKSGHAVDGKGGLVDPGKRGTEVKVRVASSNSEPGPSTVGKRKRESDATASKAEQLPKKRVRLEHVDIDDGSPTSDANVSDLEVPQPLEKAKPRYTDVGRDSSAQPATPRSATPSAPPPPTSQSGGGSQPPLLPDSEPARDDERNGSGASAGETTSDWSTTGGGKSHTQMEADGKEPGPATLENALLSHRKNSSPQSNGETEGCVSQASSSPSPHGGSAGPTSTAQSTQTAQSQACEADPEFIAAESNTDPQLVSTIPGVSFTGSKVVPTTSGTGATLAPPRPPFPGPGGSEVVNANASAAGSTLAVQQGSTQQPSPGEPASGTEIGGLLALSDRPAASSTPLESVHIRGSPAVAPVVPTAPAAPSLPSPPSLISDVASIVAASRARDIPPAVTPICPLGVVTANVSSSAVTGPPSAQCVVAAMTVEYSDLEHRCSTAWDRCR